MRLLKLGKIFDPRAHHFANRWREFAQSPQTLLLEDGVRIYFSTRAVDPDGSKYRSHVAFVDFEDDLKTIRRISTNEVVPLGGLGCFDEHGIFPMSILPVGDEVWGYTTGWNRRVSVSVDTAIGIAVSRDGGETFERQGDGPVLGPSLHEPFLVGDGYVLQAEGRFHMLYIFGQRWIREAPGAVPDRVYKIAHATSDDGFSWVKRDGKAIISDVLGPDECQALPSVVKFGGSYHMVFCYREAHGFRNDPSKAYRLGYAWSADLENWTRDDAQLGFVKTSDAWDSTMQCYPHFFVFSNKLYLLYNGNAFGREGFGLAKVDT